MIRTSIRPSVAAPILVVLFGMSGGLATASAAECKGVRGQLEETLVAGPGCLSPVGLCTVAQMFGTLKGQARFTASAIIASADTPTTGVVFVVGDIVVVDAQMGTKLGTLVIKNAASFRTVADGDLTDTQVIIGGTGDLAGATGSLRVSGNFVGTTGSASFEGSVCLP